MTYLELLVFLQEKLNKANYNPAIAYDLILKNTPSIHNKEELIDIRNEHVSNVDAIVHDLDLMLNHDVPLSRLMHKTQFYGYPFVVHDGVFAPRPETELLVETVINTIEQKCHVPVNVVDLGCGTGVIGITINKVLGQEVRCVGVDLNPKAIANATENNTLNQTHVQFIQMDMVKFLQEQPDHIIDVIVSNPPYIAADDSNVTDSVKKWDPDTALYAQKDGLAFYEAICREADRVLKPDGFLAFEIGFQQGNALQSLCQQFLPDFTVKIYKDYAHHDRVVLIERRPHV